MARKDRLNNLLDGITSPEPEGPVEAATPAEAPDLTGEEFEKLNALRMSKRGRPKGRKTTGQPKEKEDRATFIVDRQTVRKLRYIALMDTKLYKTVIAEAFTGYISEWEEAHGPIKFKED